jgi:hypothetical protein
MADVAELRCGDRLVGRYHYGPELARPFLEPLLDRRGRPVTCNGPADHPHHRGVWFGHRDVAGVDHWTEFPGHGRMVHRGFDAIDPGGFVERLDWLGADDAVLVSETRVVRAHETGLDVELRLRAGSPVTLGANKDAGFAVRVAPSFEALHNSEGREGEAECWSRRARWCAFSGPIGTVAVLDHPENPGHPTTWHVRDYGLLAANPFLERPMDAAPELVLRYRVVVGGDIEHEYRAFAADSDEAVTGQARAG